MYDTYFTITVSGRPPCHIEDISQCIARIEAGENRHKAEQRILEEGSASVVAVLDKIAGVNLKLCERHALFQITRPK